MTYHYPTSSRSMEEGWKVDENLEGDEEQSPGLSNMGHIYSRVPCFFNGLRQMKNNGRKETYTTTNLHFTQLTCAQKVCN